LKEAHVSNRREGGVCSTSPRTRSQKPENRKREGAIRRKVSPQKKRGREKNASTRVWKGKSPPTRAKKRGELGEKTDVSRGPIVKMKL